jgi:hypothetical protein
MLVAAFALQAPREVSAAEERLSWDAPRGCPGVEAVRAAVSAVAGSRNIHFGPLRSARGRVERAGSEWRLSLELVVGSRRRSRILTAPSCEDLVQAAGVAIALAFDTSLDEADDAAGSAAAAEATEPAPPDPETELGSSARPDALTPVPLIAPDAPSSPSPSEFQPVAAAALQLGANALVDGAALRRAALGVELSFGWRLGALDITAYGAWLPVQRDVQVQSGSAEFSLLAGGLRAGYLLLDGVAGVAGYLSLELGRLSARGIGLIDARTFNDLWVAPGAGVELEKRLAAGWSLEARVGAIVPLVRESYAVNADERIHRPAAVGVRAGAGVGFAW